MDKDNVTRIRTDNKPRALIYWSELKDKEKAEFNWLDTAEKQDGARFFKYRGHTYCLDEFMVIDYNQPLPGWHGYLSDSYFSGVLIKWSKDFEAITAATYYS
jgi:hypothetical protein